ncbi:MAG: hypothetical protein ACTIJ9_05610 [Aequorivita sp.]
MKKVFLILFAAGLMTTGFTSCREKTTGEKVEDVADDIGDDIDDALN